MVHVTVLGAAGGIGQPLSLLLKNSPYVSTLHLYDIRNAPGVAADVSHINTDCVVRGFEGEDQLGPALRDSQLVVIPAGVPRKPGMSRDDLFNINAGIVRALTTAVATHCPTARILIISNPVNSTVPIAAETLKKLGKFNPARLFGVTSLDLARAQSFLLDTLGRNSYSIDSLADQVTVIGGHSGNTIIPVFKDKKFASLLLKDNGNAYKEYIRRVQFGGDEVVKAKNGAGSATLSMALAGFNFAQLVIRSLNGETIPPSQNPPAYVYLPGLQAGAAAQAALRAVCDGTAVDYFALPLVLHRGDIQAVDHSLLAHLTKEEQLLLQTALPDLIANIRKGAHFARGNPKL